MNRFLCLITLIVAATSEYIFYVLNINQTYRVTVAYIALCLFS